MKQVIRILLAALVLASVTAAPVFAEDGKRLFKRKGCAICHGVDGKNTLNAQYPRLAGQHKDYIVAQLKAFKAKERLSGNGTQMVAWANSLNDAQMDEIATYLSSL